MNFSNSSCFTFFSTVMCLKSFCSGSMFGMLIKGLKCIALSGNQYSHVGCLEIGVNFVTLHKLGCVQNALLSRVLAPMAACARKQRYFAYNNLGCFTTIVNFT